MSVPIESQGPTTLRTGSLETSRLGETEHQDVGDHVGVGGSGVQTEGRLPHEELRSWSRVLWWVPERPRLTHDHSLTHRIVQWRVSTRPDRLKILWGRPGTLRDYTSCGTGLDVDSDKGVT